MGPFSGISEIIESRDKLSSTQKSKATHRTAAHDKGQKSLLLKLGSDNSQKEDINKLFEAINIKTPAKVSSPSVQVGTSPSRKDAVKKPIGVDVPVSLKQALRGLSISQASEMASMKRLSKSSTSPRVSEAGKIASLYRSVVVEAGESSHSRNEMYRGEVEISLVPEECTNSYGNLPPHLGMPKLKSSNQCSNSTPRYALVTTEEKTEAAAHYEKHEAFPSPPSQENSDGFDILEPKMKTSNQSGHSSPRYALARLERGKRSTLMNDLITGSTEVQSRTSSKPLQEKKHMGPSSLSCHNTGGTLSIRLKNKASAPKLRRKGRLLMVPSSSNAIKSNKGSKTTRKALHLTKPILRNKPIIIKKKVRLDSTSVGSTSNVNYEITSALNFSGGQLLCQRCQCTLTNVRNNMTEASPASNYASVSKLGFASNSSSNSGAVVENANTNTKTRENGDSSQSSKSSLGEYSCTTSISEESKLCGSSRGNRPHMSKDLRWEAIHHVRKQHGFLGLRHFNLLKKLGSGDIGTVYLAKLVGTNCLFAIKVMDNDFLARRKKLPRAQTEREILSILDHPFLPTLFAQFTADNLSCLVMEYCPGGDLHVLRQKQLGRYFSEQAARFYVAEVLLALEYLHMLGVIYRDLKPENILVREDGHIMLTDFDLSLRCTVNPTLLKSSSLAMDPPRVSGPCKGSSCIDPFCIEPSCQVACFSPRILPSSSKARKLKADSATHPRSLPQLVAEPADARSNSFVGTHEYLAPEIIRGEGHGSAVDWWTFGVFLYELLYGKTPFKGARNGETLDNVVVQSLKFPNSPMVSFQARDLIQGLLVKEPENRLGSEKGAAEIKHHPFFHGLNWALIRCAIPPQLPEFFDAGINGAFVQKGTKYLQYVDAGEDLEFELF
ncbi:hypothetical protein RHGRI_011281 [Rhododendron griersonianum]|uniref:non-specific serine/threonine protein kinase n=1 Tax=Rhododendron griersonianum TaxID=479676 RepID=A0AAV6KM21_9ERIC|nr:hypothetical protein RHGRI_011281 [Rhododendron griersonianum]